MKVQLFILILLFFNDSISAQIIDCDLLVNIDNIENKSIVENSFSKEKIIVNKDLTKGMIVSEKEIKLINGLYGNTEEKDDSYVLATISTCEIILKQSEITNLNIKEPSQINNQMISIFPVPSRDFITINWSKNSVSMVSLISLEGKILETKNINNQLNEVSFDVSGLSIGIYQVLILDNDNMKMYKIIKQ